MKRPIWGASHDRAIELMAAGCPIDYPDTLPRHSFRAEQLLGYLECCVYALGPIDTGYVIALRLATDRPSGTVISHWSFEPPWPDHIVDWDYEPEEVIPKKYWDGYRSFVDSRLMKVLNERRLIRRGYPVEGILCGRSFQPIGESFHGVIPAKLRFTDDIGNTVGLPIDLGVYGLSKASARRPYVRSEAIRVPCETEIDHELVSDRLVEPGTKVVHLPKKISQRSGVYEGGPRLHVYYGSLGSDPPTQRAAKASLQLRSAFPLQRARKAALMRNE